MDPWPSSPRGSTLSFPRTGGDGPVGPVRLEPLRVFPPHRRGWTLPRGRFTSSSAVSPAQAGMDPCSRRRASTCKSFPRTGGDGPGGINRATYAFWFPPHRRGWTHSLRWRPGGPCVSPAQAGMDLLPAHPRLDILGFPRTGGDGPLWPERPAVASSFPPHRRGWTCQCTAGGNPGRVSPAQAGMDPCRGTAPGAARSFPRTGGDGPGLYHDGKEVRRFPPHRRGWTLRRSDLVGLP